MAEVARFFDTVQYGEGDQAEVQSRFRPTGVLYEVGGRLAVSAPGGMFVSVADGEAMVEGFHYKNTAAKVLAIASNASGSTRFDRVVLRLDRVANSLTAVIKQGVAGSGIYPALTQVVGGTWELPVAGVTVLNGAVTITSGNILDHRAYGNIIHNAIEIGLGAAQGTFAGVQRRVLTTDASGLLYFDENAAGRKNYVQNSAFRVNQRGAANAVSSGDYAADRWPFTTTNNVGGYTNGVVSVTTGLPNLGSEAGNAMYFIRANGTALASNTLVSVRQNIEGLEMLHLMGMPMMVSFWAFSTKAGTYGVNLEQIGTNWKYLASFNLAASNTWQFFSIPVPWSASGTWLTGAVGALALRFVAEAGSAQKAGVSNAWYNGVELAASAVNNAMTATNDTMYIAAPKLEVGTLATRWEFEDYETELMRAYRYLYCEQPTAAIPSWVHIVSQIVSMTTFPVHMRVAPGFTQNITPVFTNGGAPASNGISNLANGAYTTGVTYTGWITMSGGNKVYAAVINSSSSATNVTNGQAGIVLLGSGVRMIFSSEM